MSQDLETIYRENYSRVFALCLRMLKNEFEAEDLTQEVFIQVAMKLGTFRGDAAFTTWLHRVTVNQVLMHFRKAKSRGTFVSLDDDELGFTAIEQATPAYLPKEELRIDLENAIRELPDGYRTTLVLHDFLGFEHAEVAQLMNVTTGTSKSQLHKARLKVQRLIKRKANPRLTTALI